MYKNNMYGVACFKKLIKAKKGIFKEDDVKDNLFRDLIS